MSGENEMSMDDKHKKILEVSAFGQEESPDGRSPGDNLDDLIGVKLNRPVASSLDEPVSPRLDTKPGFTQTTTVVQKAAPPKVPLFVDDNPGPADQAATLDYFISYSSDTEDTLTQAAIYEDYDSEVHNNWSANFHIVSGSMNGAVTYSAEVVRFPDDGGDPATQTFYRLPLIRGGLTVSSGGFYQEDTLCLNGKGRQQLLKLG